MLFIQVSIITENRVFFKSLSSCTKPVKMVLFNFMVMEMEEYNNINKNQAAGQIELLKQDLFRQKESISSVKELIKQEIDRDFPVDLWALSERELDNEMGERLSFLNDDIDTRPDSSSISSHRKIIGKPIVLIKRLFMRLTRFYTNALMEKQRRFNEQAVAFHLASFIRFRQIEQRLSGIEEKIKSIEENKELLMEQLETIKHDHSESHPH